MKGFDAVQYEGADGYFVPQEDIGVQIGRSILTAVGGVVTVLVLGALFDAGVKAVRGHETTDGLEPLELNGAEES